MVQKYTESVTFEDSLKHYRAPMERLPGATRGLGKDEKVPRTRIELVTRGFSVRQEHLYIEILTHLVAIGQAAQELLSSVRNNGHKIQEAKELLRHQTIL